MPQISKIRIVNFRYNDGKRLIADELFDLASKDREEAMNVLINLANGGGKSVLVQLVMQPIIPKAKVAGRRIESFFTKASDHCFILLEWLKDGSREKLLTGIAMAASDTSAVDDDNSRGASIKYYTFYSNYSHYNSQFDIVNLPLSKKENGRFIPADFHFIRDISKKSGGTLIYYASDDGSAWQKKLAEYGIIQGEWKRIEQLNAEEGGLNKYLGELKTSDAVIDKLLIPAIEENIGQTAGKEDSSLSTMLLSYATKYGKKRDVISERDALKRFASALEQCQSEAEQLYTADENVKKAFGAFFAFSDELDKRMTELKTQQNKIAQELESSENEIRSIRFEEVSAEYYARHEALENALAECRRAGEELDEFRSRLDSARERKKIIECAYWFGKLKAAESEISAIKTAIDQKEKGEEGNSKIAQLRYSAYRSIKDELASRRAAQAEVTEKCHTVEQALQDANSRRREAEKEEKEAQNRYHAENGKLDSAYAETDAAVEKAGFDIARMLDGSYSFDDIEREKASRDGDAAKVKESLAAVQEKERSLQARLGEIPEKKEKLRLEKDGLEKQKEELENEKACYIEAENKIMEICLQYNLDFAGRFTPNIYSYLCDENEKAAAETAAIVRRIGIAEDAILAAKRSSVHVPKAAIDYLNGTNIRYQTCEQYLLAQVENGMITKERCLKILESYPAVAFGVMMDEKEKVRFFEYGRADWLPAMIPIFTPKQMENVLSIQKERQVAIAFYSEDYFEDKEHYLVNLQQKLENLKHEHTRLQQKNKTLSSQIECVKAFEYSQSWLDEQERRIETVGRKIEANTAEHDKLYREEDGIKGDIKLCESQIKDLQRQIQGYERFCEDYGALCRRITKEEELSQSAAALRRDAEEAENVLKNADRKMSELSKDLEDVQNTKNQIDCIVDELCKAEREVENCNECAYVEGHWQDLLGQYRELQSAQSKELADLQNKLREKQKSASEYRRELDKRKCLPEAYETVQYSQSDEVRAEKEEKDAEERFGHAQEVVVAAKEQRSKAEAFKERADTDLRKFGEEPLPKSKIGTDFEKRISDVKKRHGELERKKNDLEKAAGCFEKVQDKVSDQLSGEARPTEKVTVVLEEDSEKQYRRLLGEFNAQRKSFDAIKKGMESTFSGMKSDYSGTFPGADQAIDGLYSMLSDTFICGDRYYTLWDQIRENRHTVSLEISRIEKDLEEFDHSRNDLIHQCTLQGQRIYDGLKQMMRSSRVEVYKGKPRQQMLRLDIPDEVDFNTARTMIAEEITQGTKELSDRIQSEKEVSEIDLRKYAEKIVGSRKLLRKYIGKDTIVLRAYKIDHNPNNAGYRTWEQTRTNNSGAEKFVVYFAIILALMKYSRSEYGDIHSRAQHSTLILDNPFGPISSRHVLDPMFEIAKQFRVQMICLSDISKQDILNCFDLVIKAVVKQRALSNVELLTHDGNEEIEHGFYRSEQIGMF